MGAAVTEMGARRLRSNSSPPPESVMKLIEDQSTIPDPLKEAKLMA